MCFLSCFMEFKRLTSAERPEWRMACFCLRYLSTDWLSSLPSPLPAKLAESRGAWGVTGDVSA